jgi:hypothetical protein
MRKMVQLCSLALSANGQPETLNPAPFANIPVVRQLTERRQERSFTQPGSGDWRVGGADRQLLATKNHKVDIRLTTPAPPTA